MKGRQKKRRIEVKQGNPFYYEDYFEHGGFVNPEDDRSWTPEDIAEQLVNVNDGGHPLNFLHSIYKKHAFEGDAEKIVISKTIELTRSQVITDKEGDIILSAWAGNIESAIYLVIAYPECLHFPFVRNAIIKGLRKMRYSPDYNIVPDLKDMFLCLIPDRHSGDLPFSDSVISDIERVVSQGNDGKLNRRERFARALNVTEKAIRKRNKGKGIKGRPPKN